MKNCQFFFQKCISHIELIERSSPIVQCNDEDKETDILIIKILSLMLDIKVNTLQPKLSLLFNHWLHKLKVRVHLNKLTVDLMSQLEKSKDLLQKVIKISRHQQLPGKVPQPVHWEQLPALAGQLAKLSEPGWGSHLCVHLGRRSILPGDRWHPQQWSHPWTCSQRSWPRCRCTPRRSSPWPGPSGSRDPTRRRHPAPAWSGCRCSPPCQHTTYLGLSRSQSQQEAEQEKINRLRMLITIKIKTHD